MYYCVSIILVLYVTRSESIYGRRIEVATKLSIEDKNNNEMEVQFLPQMVRKADGVFSENNNRDKHRDESVYKGVMRFDNNKQKKKPLIFIKKAHRAPEQQLDFKDRKISDPNRVVGHYCYDEVVHKCETTYGLQFCWDETEKICSL